MKLLYSDILPLSVTEEQETICACINRLIKEADCVKIAVGYVSRASLEELDHLAGESGIVKLSLTIGMYFIEGMPESAYHVAVALNQKWTKAETGEIRIVRSMKYHGKLYCFFKNGQPFAAIVGSANLGVLKLEASNRRQYEVAVLVTESSVCSEIADFIAQLQQENCSTNIANITNMPLVREINVSLKGIDKVEELPPKAAQLYFEHKTSISFRFPIKVPAYSERFMDDMRHFTKSNINVCYAAPRSKRKARDWYEMQTTVDSSIKDKTGYPEKNVPFYVVTDDGYWFLAHTTSDGNKQFSAVGDELILGRWIKGRLAAAGLVTPVNNTGLDTERKGMITKEILQAYGCDSLLLTKTDQKALDADNIERDVWIISFESTQSSNGGND